MKNIDVLNLEWSSTPSRDRQMATLVCNYLRYQGFKVIEGSIFNGFYLIRKYKPSVFFITNSIGAVINHDIVKYANARNLKVVTLLSEGNLDEEKGYIVDMIWGHNSEKILYEDLQMQWNEKSRNLTYKYSPDLRGKIRISGAVGFDVYKISTKTDRSLFLKKYSKSNFIKVIGVGCWDFGSFYPEDHRYNATIASITEKDVLRFRKDQSDFNLILKEIVKNNPNILFLVKEHPGCIGGLKASGIEGLQDLNNVLILKNEESIFDCISVSDFWIIYESTTAMEAWLLEKQTCLLNPSGIDFIRDKVHMGSPNYQDTNSLQAAIETFYKTGILPGFDKLKFKRQEIIKSTIQWEDGLNHVRAGNEILEILKNVTEWNLIQDSNVYIVKMLKQMFYWYLSPYLFWIKRFEEYSYHVRSFKKSELKKFQTKRMNEQVSYYNKLNLDKDALLDIKCI